MKKLNELRGRGRLYVVVSALWAVPILIFGIVVAREVKEFEAVFVALMVAIAGPALLYGAGKTILWIAKGFKGDKDS